MACAVTDAAEVWFACKSEAESGYATHLPATVFAGTATATLTGLTAETLYTVYAYASANGEQYASEPVSFSTQAAKPSRTDHAAWYELPAPATDGTAQTVSFYADSERNYTMYYDRSLYAALWVAYPLAAGHMGSGRASNDPWSATPGIDIADQINIWSGSYGVTLDDGSADYYARGHQIPNGDRNRGVTSSMSGSQVPLLNAQTYYATNATPQIQNAFNGGIWNKLEEGVRGIAKATSDTVYVVTGAVFRKVGGNEEVKYIKPAKDTKRCPVPNYYYKVLLKVKRATDGSVISASTVGVWLEHRRYSGDSYLNYTTSVDQIEAWTGFDFFANLPDAVAAAAESNTSWSTFSSF